ncbi:hypothetical protein GCM10017673_46730 [Streptosporangium violaceochromogenes]|nr:hypothetical protein GCM10017673_46730 [Streptosporangium violaceochromogenes]
MIGRWERGERLPSRDAVDRLDGAYGAEGVLIALYGFLRKGDTGKSADMKRKFEGNLATAALPKNGGDNDMERRTIMQLLATLGTGATLPLDALETLRTTFDRAVDSAGEHALEDWEQIAYQHAYDIRVDPPTALIGKLAVDVADVRHALEARPDIERGGLQRVGAQLAAIMAMALAETGEFWEARRWWRTARVAADASGDLDLRVWVRGRNALVETGAPRPAVTSVLRLAAEAEHLAGGRPSVGLAEAWFGRSIVMAVSPAGAAPTPEEVLGRYDDIGAALPAEVTGEHSAIWGWPAQRHANSRATLAVLLGAPTAHEEVVRQMEADGSGADLRSVATGVMRKSMCLISASEAPQGLTDAVDAYTRLPREHRTTSITWWARQVMRTTPEQARSLPAAEELRTLTA